MTCVRRRLRRRVWDLNPRWHRCHDGFRDRSLRPLGQLSLRRHTCDSAGRAYLESIPQTVTVAARVASATGMMAW